MIDKREMMDLLVDASPGFEETRRTFEADWAENLDPPYYLLFGDYIRHMSDLMRSEDHATLRRIFATFERLLLEGDSYVKEATVVGLLEDLQNCNLHRETTPEQFETYLGPQAVGRWAELYGFWGRVNASRGGA